MKVIEMTTNTFWKGELGVKGVVVENQEEYKVSLYVKGSQVNDYSCSCAQGNSYKGMCVHSKAVFQEFLSKRSEGGRRLISTSQEVRTMIREYTNREVAAIMEEKKEEPVDFVPKLILGRKEMKLLFKIGRSRMYLVKDLAGFARDVRAGAYVEYGKNMAFRHGLSVFSQNSRPLVDFVLEQINLYEEHYNMFRKPLSPGQLVQREMNMNLAQRDRFFRLMSGKVLEVEDVKGVQHSMEIVDENPKLELSVGKEGASGIRLWMPKKWQCFSGEEFLYLLDEVHIYRCSREFKTGMQVFLEQLLGVPGEHSEVLIHDHDIPLFYERVLKKIRRYCTVDAGEVDFEIYKPKELAIRFYFDSGGANEVTMCPTLSYGDFSFHPMEDEKVPRTVCRDVPGEFRVSQLITRYFKFREDGAKHLIIRDDEEEIYRLLTEGIPQFMEMGEVFLSDPFRQMEVLPSPKIALSVNMSDGYVWLDLDSEEMSGAELNRILSEYSGKKKFVRLKNGQFMTLDDGGLLTVADLVQRFSVSKNEIQEKKIKLPGYRALYLDSLLKENTGISTYRSHFFKALVRDMKSVEDSDFDVPDTLKKVLRLYQKRGFYWMKTLDHYGFGGILADDMGLGKTIQVLSLLLDEKQRGQTLPSLIVCPASLIYNWESEIRQFAPQLKTAALSGTAKEREEMLADWKEYDVLVTSYDLLKRDVMLYEPLEFRFQIIDEAQYIKNAATQSARVVKSIKAVRRFALTGTPIENRLAELWSIFDFLMPGFLFGYQKFKKEYEIPIMKGEETGAGRHLQMIIGPFVLRRLKKDVLKELPEKMETVVYSKLEGEQRKVYSAYASKLRQSLEGSGEKEYATGKIQILSELTRLRQLCCDPRLCLDRYGGESAKLSTCLQLVQSAIEGGHKILLFSQFTTMLDLIGKALEKEGIQYYSLTGSDSKETRQLRVSEFQTNEIPIFLISLKAGGTGLNLTAADVVIHYDPWWNVAAQNQATDRTHRIGQQKQVTVFKLIAKDTIEENIMKLQQLKENLANQIITEGALSLGNLDKNELLKLLEDGM